jgi:SUF system FeS assembly protein, NifU family
MDLKSLYREIVNDHNLHPAHKYEMENPDIVLRGVNPTCGDDITLMLKIRDDVITEGSFTGGGCAISTASVDMMLDNVIGLKTDQARDLIRQFFGMIDGDITDDRELEALNDVACLKDISHMPARVKCALLGWSTLKEILG